jgi:hypothetical protein
MIGLNLAKGNRPWLRARTPAGVFRRQRESLLGAPNIRTVL